MAISLKAAQEAMAILRRSSGAELFNAMTKSGGYLFKKHQTKATALAAAKEDHQTKGYFKKVVTTPVPDLAAYKKLTGRQLKHVVGLNVSKPQPRHFGGDKVSTTQTEALGSVDFTNVLTQIVFKAECVGYYEANADPDKRFLYITRMPAGYVGRSIDENEEKTQKGITNAVIIVVAENTEQPFILNMFPADDLYVARQTKLR